MKKFTSVHGFIYTNEINNKSFGIYTELAKNGMVTLKECKELYSKLQAKFLKNEEYIKSFELELSNYREYNENGTPIFASEENPDAVIGNRKSARYYINSNTLRIYENNMPIYENANGIICNDRIALADSLC